MLFSVFPGMTRENIAMFYDPEGRRVAFNDTETGTILFNLHLWIELGHSDKHIEAWHFWFHTFCRETAHNIIPDRGAEHNYVLQMITTRNFHAFVNTMVSNGHFKDVVCKNKGKVQNQVALEATNIRIRQELTDARGTIADLQAQLRAANEQIATMNEYQFAAKRAALIENPEGGDGPPVFTPDDPPAFEREEEGAQLPARR